jgi:hypothetical protein
MSNDYTPTTVNQGYGQETTINLNFTDIETAIGLQLSRTNSTDNAMAIDLDMGSNALINASNVSTTILTIGGQTIDFESVQGVLPAQSGQAGKFLTTDGLVSSWADVTSSASNVTNVPAGNIAATDVQAALNELDTEKAAASHTHVEADITDLDKYTQAAADALLLAKADLASPAFTGNPTAPTQTAGDNSTKLATTAYADAAGGGGVVVQIQRASPKTNTFSTTSTSYVAVTGLSLTITANDAANKIKITAYISGGSPSTNVPLH